MENRIFAPNGDFDDFWLLPLWPIFWPEVSKNVIRGRKWSLETLKIILDTLDDDFWWLEQILKNHENFSFLSIFLLWAQRRKIDENENFSWFFKICSNHQKSSSKVSRMIFKVSRDQFRPRITFLDTSGQKIGHNGRSQKSPKSPFGAKIRFSTKWFKSFKMMLYGREWIPRVF